MESVSLMTVAVFCGRFPSSVLDYRFALSCDVDPVGVTLAWLTIVLSFPFGGAVIYLAFGETRLGTRRAERAARIHEPYMEWLADLENRTEIHWSQLGPECEPPGATYGGHGRHPADVGEQCGTD